MSNNHNNDESSDDSSEDEGDISRYLFMRLMIQEYAEHCLEEMMHEMMRDLIIDRMIQESTIRATGTAAVTEQYASLSTEEQLRMRTRSDYGNERGDVDVDSYSTELSKVIPMLKAMLLREPSSPTMNILKGLAQRSPPNIVEEFRQHCKWPFEFDKAKALKLLHCSYLDASNNPWGVSLLIIKNKFPVDQEMMLKRWNGPYMLKEFMRRRNSLSIGDIVLSVDSQLITLYDPTIRSVFVNAPPNPLTEMNAGTVHVSIGFNDLGELLSKRAFTQYDNENPLNFIGVEMSDFAIARCLVIKELLGDSNVPVGCIIQIWYSSGWTEKALEVFRTACRKILEVQSCSLKVIRYLRCWLSDEPISAVESRARYFKLYETRSNQLLSDACSLHRLQDRLSVIKYFITGELIPAEDINNDPIPQRDNATVYQKQKAKKNNNKKKRNSKTDKKQVQSSTPLAFCGSMVFWNTPPNSPPLETDVVFNTILMETILEHLSDDSSIVTTITKIKVNQLEQLRKEIIDGRVIIDLHSIFLEESNVEGIKAVVGFKPDTISWSNVMDYQNLKSFHRLARQIGPNSRHYGYSMNWSATIYGSCIIDYIISEDTLRIQEIIQEALSPTNHPLITIPFFDHPMNLTGYVLASKMHRHWIQHFEQCGPCKVKSNIVPAAYPLYRLNTIKYLEWSYSLK